MIGGPSLGLTVEIASADGSNVNRWSSSSDDPGDRPQGISFRTKRGDGFADASCSLARRIDGEYVDLGLLRDLKLVGDDGTVAYEGRVTDLPRSLDSEHGVSVQAVGWMAHAKDRQFREIYVDRDISRWRGPSAQRQVANSPQAMRGSPSMSVLPDDKTGVPVVELALTGTWSARAQAEAWYTVSLPIGFISASWMRGGDGPILPGDPAWDWEIALCADDVGTGAISTGNLHAGGAGGPANTSLTGGASYSAAALILFYNAGGGITGQKFPLNWSNLAVYGNHGLTIRDGGFYVSDLIRDMTNRFAPLLNTAGVQDTTFVVDQAAYLDATTPYDAWTRLNTFHLWSLSVWENRTLTYAPVDLTDYDWEVRLGDYGVSIDLQGDSADQLCNGVAVTYTDVVTGVTVRVEPTDFAELRDDSIENPVNAAGIQKWEELALSFPATQTMALQLGRVALADFNAPKAPGSIKVQGHIRDRAGHLQPVWKVRADDRVSITNFVGDQPRLIGSTDYSHDSFTLTMSIDAPAQRIDAVFDRITSSLAAANIA